jgi:hypothetical protein
LIAVAAFQIAAGGHPRIQAPLTKTGRRLLRGGKRVRARVVLAALGPKGNTLRRFETVTLRLPRHR